MEGESYEVGSFECDHPLCAEISKHLIYYYSSRLSKMTWLPVNMATRLDGYYLVAFKKYCYQGNLSSYLQDPPFRRKKAFISVTLNQSGKHGKSNQMYLSIEELVKRKLSYMLAEERSLNEARLQEEEAHHQQRMAQIKAEIDSYQPIFDREEAARRTVRLLRKEIEDLRAQLRVSEEMSVLKKKNASKQK